jgi:hypothetical protein
LNSEFLKLLKRTLKLLATSMESPCNFNGNFFKTITKTTLDLKAAPLLLMPFPSLGAPPHPA